jgi:transcriptional regulator with XRE-family HTH domain
MTFAERLRELREAAGLTQAALADASGLSLGAVRNYEQGIREPYWSAIFKLADALGVSCEAFRGCADSTDEHARTQGRLKTTSAAAKKSQRKKK